MERDPGACLYCDIVERRSMGDGLDVMAFLGKVTRNCGDY